MIESFTSPLERPRVTSDAAKAEALHAMGSFYVRQGFPRQGLSLLLAAHRFDTPSMELNRAIAHAFIIAGAPQKAIAMLDALAPALEGSSMLRAANRLRARALLALGRVSEARAAFGKSARTPEEPMTNFRLVGRRT